MPPSVGKPSPLAAGSGLQCPGSWASFTKKEGSGRTLVQSPFPGSKGWSLKCKAAMSPDLAKPGHRRSPEMRGRGAGLSHAPSGTPSQVRRLQEGGDEASQASPICFLDRMLC